MCERSWVWILFRPCFFLPCDIYLCENEDSRFLAIFLANLQMFWCKQVFFWHLFCHCKSSWWHFVQFVLYSFVLSLYLSPFNDQRLEPLPQWCASLTAITVCFLFPNVIHFFTISIMTYIQYAQIFNCHDTHCYIYTFCVLVMNKTRSMMWNLRKIWWIKLVTLCEIWKQFWRYMYFTVACMFGSIMLISSFYKSVPSD